MKHCFAAEDYVGLETTVISEGMTIDMTPPIMNRDRLKVSEDYLTTENSIQITHSSGAFSDPESGEALKSSLILITQQI